MFNNNKCYFTNTPDAVTSSTADFTVFLVLAALRASTYCERVAASGLWHKGLELSTDPMGLTLGKFFHSVAGEDCDLIFTGVFGMGRIGKDFVKKMRAFGVNTIYNTRTRLSTEVEEELGISYASKDELIKTADIICCLCPGNKETYHLLDKEEFSAMKGQPTCFV